MLIFEFVVVVALRLHRSPRHNLRTSTTDVLRVWCVWSGVEWSVRRAKQKEFGSILPINVCVGAPSVAAALIYRCVYCTKRY